MPRKKSNGSLMNLKVSEEERKEIISQAEKYMQGNLSAWLRLAGVSFEPGKSESGVVEVLSRKYTIKIVVEPCN